MARGLPPPPVPNLVGLARLGAPGDDVGSARPTPVGKPRAWVEHLGPDEAILLAAKMIEVNADFFTRTVIPTLDVLFGQVKQRDPTSGSTASNA